MSFSLFKYRKSIATLFQCTIVFFEKQTTKNSIIIFKFTTLSSQTNPILSGDSINDFQYITV